MYQRLNEVEKNLLPKVKGMMVEEDLRALFSILKDMALDLEAVEREVNEGLH
jgi:hypothetical protein